MSRMKIGPKNRQKGAAALLTTALLALILGVVTLNTTNIGVMEQRITGNDLRAREAQEAAEAGLEYAMAWAGKNKIWPAGSTALTLTCPGGTGCPTLSSIATSATTTGEGYNLSITYSRPSPSSNTIKVTSSSTGASDGLIIANVESYIRQVFFEMFDPGAPTPPPWVAAGCINEIKGGPQMFMLDASNDSVITGSTKDNICLDQGNLDVYTWSDSNTNWFKDGSGEEGATTAYNRDDFSGCPSTNCAWNNVFKMPLANAVQLATNAGHVFNSKIPCGPPSAPPSVYVINNGGPINTSDIDGSCSGPGVDNKTIGTPTKPIILIVPSAAGCPKFNGGITIYGIIYFQSTTDCASNGWGGANVYGSVIWEGNAFKINSNAEFIEVNWENQGDLNDVFDMPRDSAPRLPGTWIDL